MTATKNQVEAAGTAQFIGAGIASLKPFPKWEAPGETPREFEAVVSWPAPIDASLHSGQGDPRRQSKF
jgi:hypothetical protein